jgi:formate dehydrogenase maturation protein FdhE
MNQPREEPGLRWNRRRNRAVTLVKQQLHATEVLQFYVKLLDLQEPIYRRSLIAYWLDEVQAQGDHLPLICLDALPFTSLRSAFVRFLRGLSVIVPKRLEPLTKNLIEAPQEFLVYLLTNVAQREDLDTAASEMGCDSPQLEFFARAYLQPLIEAIGSRCNKGSATWQQAKCPHCGWPPHLATLSDELEIKGRRLLICSLCSCEWPFPRTTCANCLETNPDDLTHHVSESLPYIRIEICQQCQHYLKTIDLREHGLAVPIVDDLASFELDLWCKEQKLTKTQRNLLAL